MSKKFAIKVTAIEEAHDVAGMRLEELMGSLRTYEMALEEDKPKKKEKNIALKVETSKSAGNVSSDGEDLAESVAEITRNLARVMKKMNMGSNRGTGSQVSSDTSQRGQSGNAWQKNQRGSQNTQRNPGVENSETDQSRKFPANIQCRECKGYGHIQSQCANTLMKSKAYTATWSDTESDDDRGQEQNGGNNLAFTAKFDDESFDDDGYDEKKIEQEMLESYKEMSENWLKLAHANERLNEINNSLKKENKELVDKVCVLEQQLSQCKEDRSSITMELERYKKGVNMLNGGTTSLEKLLNCGRRSTNHSGLGYIHEKDEVQEEKVGSVNKRKKKTQWIPICHYCKKEGHIRPRCFKYLGDLRQQFGGMKQTLKKWVPKKTETRQVAYLSTSTKHHSGCSKYMTGVAEYLKNIEACENHTVSFGDGLRAQVVGKGLDGNKFEELGSSLGLCVL